MHRSRSIVIVIAIVALGVASRALAASSTFTVSLTGAKEVAAGGTGDPDGSAIGSITLDSGSGGSTATASWNFTLSNLATPSDFHIHTGSATQQGGVLIPFGVQAGELTATSFIGSRTGLSSTNMANVLANPGGFYLNIHNGEFPNGAVRAQVPEPASASVLVVLLSGLISRRRR